VENRGPIFPKFTKTGLFIRHSQGGIFFWLVFSELTWTEMDANQIWTRKIMSFFGTKTSFSHRIENWFRFWARLNYFVSRSPATLVFHNRWRGHGWINTVTEAYAIFDAKNRSKKPWLTRRRSLPSSTPC